jgi:hypothetical protein
MHFLLINLITLLALALGTATALGVPVTHSRQTGKTGSVPMASFYTYNDTLCDHDDGGAYWTANATGCYDIGSAGVKSAVLDGINAGCSCELFLFHKPFVGQVLKWWLTVEFAVQFWQGNNCDGAWGTNVTTTGCIANGAGIKSFNICCE